MKAGRHKKEEATTQSYGQACSDGGLHDILHTMALARGKQRREMTRTRADCNSRESCHRACTYVFVAKALTVWNMFLLCQAIDFELPELRVDQRGGNARQIVTTRFKASVAMRNT